MNRTAVWLLALSCAACGFGHDVQQFGNYESLPTTYITDSAPYPLASLLIIEQDTVVGQTRLYYFTGDLRAADLGFQDLRRIGAQFGGFAMAFEPVREHLDAPTEDGPDALHAQLGDDTLTLERLDDDGLRRTGAQRYLSSVSSADYAVRAYFGVTDSTDTLPELSIDAAAITFDPTLMSAELEPMPEAGSLELAYHSTADYLTLELAQAITPRDPAADVTSVDGLVRTLLPPNSSYAVSARLLTNVAGQGCWSRERPLQARVRQTKRRYQQQARGDWAVIYERTDGRELEPETWTALLSDELQPASYCDDYE